MTSVRQNPGPSEGPAAPQADRSWVAGALSKLNDCVFHLGADSVLSDSRLVPMASAGRRGDAAPCREPGVIGHLSRPVQEPELLEMELDKAIRLRGSHGGAGARPKQSRPENSAGAPPQLNSVLPAVDMRYVLERAVRGGEIQQLASACRTLETELARLTDALERLTEETQACGC